MSTTTDTSITSKPVGLWPKMLKIQAEAGRIPKNGWNDFNKYKYVLEADMVDFLRPRLAEVGLTVTFTCDPEFTSYHPRKNQKGNEEFLVAFHLIMTVTDTDTGQKETFSLPCAGSDQGDKGVYKAITGGKKYLLQTAFNIATGDDPERMDKPQSGAGARRKAGADAPGQAGSEEVSPKRSAMFARIFALKDELGWDDAGLDQYVLDHFKVDQKRKLSDEQVEKLGLELKAIFQEYKAISGH
jgi:hypothetical protein